MGQDLLLCSGAPLDMCDDHTLGERVRYFRGTTIVCGGTTSKIVARELGREVTVNLSASLGSSLPPTSTIEGIDLVSEGVITLGRVRNLLQSVADQGHSYFTAGGASGEVDVRIAEYLLRAERMVFVVGTRMNKAHFDPFMPIRLERRVDLLRDLARLLGESFGKRVEVEYL